MSNKDMSEGLRSLYGLKQAGNGRNLLLRSKLTEWGYTQRKADPCLNYDLVKGAEFGCNIYSRIRVYFNGHQCQIRAKDRTGVARHEYGGVC
jgi:hypothetical protein